MRVFLNTRYPNDTAVKPTRPHGREQWIPCATDTGGVGIRRVPFADEWNSSALAREFASWRAHVPNLLEGVSAKKRARPHCSGLNGLDNASNTLETHRRRMYIIRVTIIHTHVVDRKNLARVNSAVYSEVINLPSSSQIRSGAYGNYMEQVTSQNMFSEIICSCVIILVKYTVGRRSREYGAINSNVFYSDL